MKIKNGELLTLLNGLQAIKNAIGKKANYAVARNKKYLEKEISFYLDQVRELQDEYCKKDENGKNITRINAVTKNPEITFASEEDQIAYNIARREIDELEVEVPIMTVKYEDIDYFGNQQETDALLFMIEEE